MNVTIDLKMLGFALIVIAVLVLIVYLVIMIRKLITTLNHANKILADVEVVSEIVSDRTSEVNEVIEEVTTSAKALSGAVNGKQSVVVAGASVAKAIMSVKNALKVQNDKDK